MTSAGSLSPEPGALLTGRPRVDLLNRLSVLQVGTSVSLAAAGAALHHLGARVAVAAGGASRVHGEDAARIIEVLDAGKERLHVPIADLADGLRSLPTADITITSLDAWNGGRWVGRTKSYAASVQEVNAHAWVTLSAYGLSGPLSGQPGSELTYLAAGGLLNYSPYGRQRGQRPTKPAGYQASFIAGHMAATGGLYAYMRSKSHGPTHVDLSVQESVMATGVALECAHLLFDCPGEGGMFRYAPPRGRFDCQDGSVYILTLDDHHWQGVKEALGNPGWAQHVNSVADRVAAAREIELSISEALAPLTVSQASGLLQGHGVPAVPINSPAMLLASDDLSSRRYFQDPLVKGERVPSFPALVSRTAEYGSGAGSCSAAAPGEREVRTPVVLDLGHVLAAPLATSWLGAMGARVVKFEDPARADIYRRRGPFSSGNKSIEASAYFSAVNYSKLSFPFSAADPEEVRQLEALIPRFDAVIENLSTARAGALSLNAEHFASSSPKAALISCSGFGRHSRYAEYRVYGANVHASGGLMYTSRLEDHTMFTIGTSWADPVASVWIAMIALAQIVAGTGNGLIADLSMTEAVAYQFVEFFSALSRDGAEKTSRGNAIRGYAPSGVYKSRGVDDWVAIAVGSDEEWEALVAGLGYPQTLAGSRFASSAGRAADEDTVSAELGKILQAMDQHDIVRRLRERSVPVSPVMSPTALTSDSHLKSREAFFQYYHPIMGDRRQMAPPWLVVGGGRGNLVRPRLLGEDRDLIDGWLSSGIWARSGAEDLVQDCVAMGKGIGMLDRDASVLVEKRGPVTHITLNRPDKLNALTDDMVRRLRVVLEEFDDDPASRVAIVSGAGRAFCSGADINQRFMRSDEEFERYGSPAPRDARAQDVLLRFVNWKPVIAAVHGYVLGAGLMLALCCDLVLADEGTKFQIAEVKHGLSSVMHWQLLRMCGGGAFADAAALTGRMWSAAEAEARNLISEVAPPGELLARADQIAEEIDSNPSAGIREWVRVRRLGLEAELFHAQAVGPRQLHMTSDFRASARRFAGGRPEQR